MYVKIDCLAILLNIVCCTASLTDEFEDVSYNLSAGNAPFFEIPCMVVGGICAKTISCPEGTRVSTRGLCPVQQKYGMECCRPKRDDEKLQVFSIKIEEDEDTKIYPKENKDRIRQRCGRE